MHVFQMHLHIFGLIYQIHERKPLIPRTPRAAFYFNKEAAKEFQALNTICGRNAKLFLMDSIVASKYKSFA